MPEYVYALDPGQMTAYSAFVVLEVIQEHTYIPKQLDERMREISSSRAFDTITNLDVVEAYRFPLKTSYPDIAEHVLTATDKLSESTNLPKLLIDITNNKAFYDYFYEESNKHKHIEIAQILITGGGLSSNDEDGIYRIPKIELIQKTQIAWQKNLIRLAQGMDNLENLIKDLENYQVEIVSTNNEVYNARTGADDDLVLALSMTVWYALIRGIKIDTFPDDLNSDFESWDPS